MSTWSEFFVAGYGSAATVPILALLQAIFCYKDVRTLLAMSADLPGVFFFSSRRRHTRYWRDWSSDVCSSDLGGLRRSGPSSGSAWRSLALGEAAGGAGVLQVVALRDHRSPHERAIAAGVVGQDAVDRKSVVEGKSVDLCGGRFIKKKQKYHTV